MTRLDYIVKGVKGTLSEVFGFRKKRIERTIDATIDFAGEKVVECENQAVEIINQFKDVADCEKGINEKVNLYIDKMAEAESFRNSEKYLKQLKEILAQEVEVEPESEKK